MGSRSKGIYGADQDLVTAPGRKIGHKRRPRVGRYVADPKSLPKPLTRAELVELRDARRRARRKAPAQRRKMLAAAAFALPRGRQKVHARKAAQRAAKAAARRRTP